MISRRTVWILGISQLVCWGIFHYLIGAVGESMVSGLGWSRPLVYGGYSVALFVMGVVSPVVGWGIDRFGGRPVMTAGACLGALGCAGLGLSHTLAVYYGAWIVLGLAMRMTLYDAAFATLARMGGPAAKRPISQITLLGGLASTVFWPIGHALADGYGWRAAVFVYAGFAVAMVFLHLAIPAGRYRGTDEERPADNAAENLAVNRARRPMAAFLYSVIVTVMAALNAGMSAHMIAILAGLGVGVSVAVWTSTLRGIGQSAARLGEVLFGGRVHPLALAVFATALLPLSFAAGLFGGAFAAAAIAFTLLYGVGNGLVTIVRGTVPLVLFDPRSYGVLVGKLLIPGFLLAALAPLAYAVVIERVGADGALIFSGVLAAVAFAAAVLLRVVCRDVAEAATPPEKNTVKAAENSPLALS